MLRSILFVCVAAGFMVPAAGSPVRIGPPDAPISTSVAVPGDARIVYISGQVPDIADSTAPPGSPKRYGDTETQTRSVLARVEKALAAQGLGLGDVVMMRVFLVAPSGQSRMDFAGMMKAYRERFGTPQQPAKPARTTVQIAGLYDPDFLVEIEVTAAK
jgi:enamine deaminase RidA (YjgF/YER057c/UK114 family)